MAGADPGPRTVLQSVCVDTGNPTEFIGVHRCEDRPLFHARQLEKTFLSDHFLDGREAEQSCGLLKKQDHSGDRTEPFSAQWLC